MYFKNLQIIFSFIICVSLVLSSPIEIQEETTESGSIQQLEPTEELQVVNDFLKITEFRGDDGIDSLLKVKGFNNDIEFINYMLKFHGYQNDTTFFINNENMACSAFQTPNESGDGFYFGKNFDFFGSNTVILTNYPDNSYSSISTVNTNFIGWIADLLTYEDLIRNYIFNQTVSLSIPDDILRIISLYTPVDGLNEKGLSISVNMLPDVEIVEQNVENNYNLTTLPIVRVLLDKAANVDEALEILKKTNYHPSFGINIHYLISDSNGKAVSVEYYEDKMMITETKVMTNHYLAEGMNNLGQYEEDKRLEIIEAMMSENPNMNAENVRDTLKASSQGMYTQWSIVYDQKNLEATYYLRSNFEQGYNIKLNIDKDNDYSDSDDETITISVDDDEIIGEDSADDNSDDEKTEVEYDN